jgi:hypothetical protein
MLAITCCICSMNIFAQADKLSRAQQLHQAKNADAARLAIDSVVKHPDTKSDYSAWTLRGFIYFEIYKRSDKQKLYSPLRDTVVASLKRSNALKPDADYAANNKKLLNNLWAGYYNMAKSYLQDSVNNVKSQIAYNRYREIYLITEPSADIKVKDVEYYIAVGSLYSDIFNRDNDNLQAQEIAKVALYKVIEQQPSSISANLNLGIMYYNQAVNMGKKLDYGADISQIEAVQENIVKLARQAEVPILRVFKTDSKNVKAVEALFYIYRMLNEPIKSQDFKAKAIALGIKFDEK